ncbi:recombinase family protein [Aeromonas caviae]|uniref:recombinase family protein n=1 Tax=Aeromonas caviae TaxID=648 RepID=UPI0038D16344
MSALRIRVFTLAGMAVQLRRNTQGKLMLTMIGAIATFEREIMLERQAEGIALAKAKGVYKGRKPTAMEKRDEVLHLLSQGIAKASVAKRLGISVSSVHRITCMSL